MNRAISHGHAMRSILGRSRVTHFMAWCLHISGSGAQRPGLPDPRDHLLAVPIVEEEGDLVPDLRNEGQGATLVHDKGPAIDDDPAGALVDLLHHARHHLG